jgi:calcium binding protein 39
MKFVLQGTQGRPWAENCPELELIRFPEVEPNPEQVYQLVTGLISEDVLYLLAASLHRLPFEARKDVQVIFSYILRFRPTNASPKSDPIALSYIINNRPEILIAFCNGYEHKESATPSGIVLRELIKSDAAAAIILYDDSGDGSKTAKGLSGVQPELPQSGNGVFWKFFNWIDQGSFELGADAFNTFRASVLLFVWRWMHANMPTGPFDEAQDNRCSVPLNKFRLVL